LPINLLKSELRSCNPFSNASVPNKGGVVYFAPKLVAMATSIWANGKSGWHRWYTQVDHTRLRLLIIMSKLKSLDFLVLCYQAI